MSWDADMLRLEIAVEFLRYGARTYEAIADCLWKRAEVAAAKPTEPKRRRTAAEMAQLRAQVAARIARRKRTVVAVRHCVVCGTAFELTAANEGTSLARVCSGECRRDRARRAP